MSRTLIATISLVLSVPLSSALMACECKIEVVDQLPSPDGAISFTWQRESCGGATVGYMYYGHLTASGETPRRGQEILRADDIGNIRFRWDGSRRLIAEYDHARIRHFSNYWWSKRVFGNDPTGNVSIVERESELAAPAP